ncbi:hypothetical protein P2H44_15280 [Albimonas sp. CAU 1670]|uniref:hypothetical protein n=1 Tax=Albimonas sp. CAU 1670 TaxID=3032599 RepID=UPI0023DC4CDE|nr:hypothetical protein [Albimonas sp. CAU 1670]MDF2233922.1 hypothetical protein [Albimonas sp. CAU 1670]
MGRFARICAKASCAALLANPAMAFEAKWVRAQVEAPNLLAGMADSPGMVMLAATLIGVATASVCAALFAGR